jgi:hypothetical protein
VIKSGEPIFWKRLSTKYGTDLGLFTEGIKYDMFTTGPFSDGRCEFATCFEALCRYPNVVQNLFSEKYSARHGFYTFYFFEKGYWKQVVIDDQIPVDKKGMPMFLVPINKNIGPLLIEKAYIKLIGIFYHLADETQMDKFDIPIQYAPMILYKLTGFVSKKLKTKYADREKLARELRKMHDFKIRVTYPNK